MVESANLEEKKKKKKLCKKIHPQVSNKKEKINHT